MKLATWSWRNWEVKAVITEDEYQLLLNNPNVEHIEGNYRGYGNDETFTHNSFNYEDVPDNMLEFFEKYAERDAYVMENLISTIEHKISKEKWDAEYN